jgi:hypothetical protein
MIRKFAFFFGKRPIKESRSRPSKTNYLIYLSLLTRANPATAEVKARRLVPTTIIQL